MKNKYLKEKRYHYENGKKYVITARRRYIGLRSRWFDMIQRCENPNNNNYKRYGGRGIGVCDEWHDYFAFRRWAIENGFREDLEIDRIDNDCNYEPTNCRWVERIVNQRNKRDTINIEMFGEVKSLIEWCDELCLTYSTVSERYRRGIRGWDLFVDFKRARAVINGKEYTLRELSREFDIPYKAIRSRYNNGKRGDDLIKSYTPKKNFGIRHIEIWGIRGTFREWEEFSGVSYQRIRDRFYAGKRGLDIFKGFYE